MKLNGSEIIVECLKEQGVDTIFGYPGGAILNVYDALYKHSDEITHILTSHEQGASHAADGYARATGKVGVCFATSGPGATNLVTGIATAYMDSVPMVAITCNVTVPLLGRDSFQEIDIAGVTMPITKHSYIVKNVKDLAKTLRNAFRIAKEGRPGPVLVDVTKDVTAAECEYSPRVPKPVDRITASIKEEDIDKAVTLIKKAKKPYVFVGGGAVISEASDELKKFVEKVDAPVCDSLMGKGAFDGSNERYTGMLGMHGTKTSNYGVSECDLLIVVGARFSDRVTGNAKKFAKNAKILQFDVDPAEINKNIKTDASVIGDVKVILEKLNEKLPQMNHNEWITEVKSYEEAHPMTYHKGVLTGPYIIEKIYEATHGDAIISTEVGQHQMWAAQYYKYEYLYAYTETPNENLVEFINELEQILPDSFWTNSFSSDQTGISMSVTVGGKAAAARTILNIRNMQSIEDVQISGITDTKDEAGNSTVTFSITGTYKALTDESAEQTDTLTVQ